MSSLILVAPAVLTLFKLVRPPNMQQILLLPYMVAAESGGYDKHLYEFQLCYYYTKINNLTD